MVSYFGQVLAPARLHSRLWCLSCICRNISVIVGATGIPLGDTLNDGKKFDYFYGWLASA